MTRFVVSHSEAKVLSAFDENSEVALPELSSTTRLVPSVVLGTVSRLIGKSLVKPFDGGRFQLTVDGIAAKRCLAQPQPSGILFVPDEVSAEVQLTGTSGVVN